MLAIGIDPGFGNFKVAKNDGALSVVRSQVGLGDIATGLTTGLRKAKHTNCYRVVYQDYFYLVGDIENYTQPVSRLDLDRFSGGPEMEALLLAAFFNLLGPGEHEACCAVGLPVHVLMAKNHSETVKGVKSWLRGDHSGTVNEKPIRVKIHDVVVLAQPLGTFFDWALDENGQWCRTEADFNGKTAIVDLGFYTLDIFVIAKGIVLQRHTWGENSGIYQAADALCRLLLQTTGQGVPLREAEEMLRADASTPLVQQVLSNMADTVVSFCERVLGSSPVRVILGTGGGMHFDPIRLKFQKRYPNSVIPQDPIGANARGLAKYAKRSTKCATTKTADAE